MNNKERLKGIVIAATLMASTMCLIGPSHADDAEIFFSTNDSKIKPNVLFVLDVSGSMASRPSGSTSGTAPKIDMMKEAVESILLDTQTRGIRIGMMSFGNGKSTLHNEIGDIDGVDPVGDKKIISQTATDTVFTQEVVRDGDDGSETYDGIVRLSDTRLTNVNDSRIKVAYRFDNFMLKSILDPDVVTAGGVGSNNGVTKAELFFGITKPINIGSTQTITVSLDPAVPSPVLEKTSYNLTNRLTGAPSVSCNLAGGGSIGYRGCDVTSLIQAKIADSRWENGNAVTFLISFPAAIPQGFNFIESTVTNAYLKMDVDNKIVGPSTITYRQAVIEATNLLRANGGTPLVRAMYDAAQYISNLKKSGPLGPYHAGTPSSPLLDGCQSTHLVLMTDGEATDNTGALVKPYIGSCVVDKGVVDKGTGGETCGRALSYWLAHTDQSNFNDPNYVTSQTISFDLTPGSRGDVFLKDIATHGGGNSYAANNTAGLIDAFTSIIESVLIANNMPMSGTVSLSAQSRYKERKEAFYSLFMSSNKNYWPGNVKGFLIKYVAIVLPSGEDSERAILYDESNSIPVLKKDGTLIENLSSLWSSGDTGGLLQGGVVGQLAAPKDRNVFTIKPSTSIGAVINLDSSASLSDKDLDVADEKKRKGLLDFARGNVYEEGGSATPIVTKKIGDAARATVQLANYGCSTGQDFLDCPRTALRQVALLAGNDGFLRGYDTASGKALYEYMPYEMLPILKDLQEEKTLSIKIVRRYGLDGRIVIYHDDKNDNDFIDKGETAYAYVVSGRGGSYIYAVDISDMASPKLAWVISDADLTKLGKTWSVPAVGKIDIGGTATPVLVFGGGYDKSQDDTPERNTDTKGNAIYIVNAKTGSVIWTTSAGMNYSIPSSVELVENTYGFITDIFVGDMGGQLWRFRVNNGAAHSSIVQPGGGNGGMVASISGATKTETRRFYQKPVVYAFRDAEHQGMLSVNIGSGYQGHPLTIDNADRFYSFHFPIDPDPTAPAKELTETDLAVVSNSTVTNESNMKGNGFMIKLEGKGEKIISGLLVDFDRIVFNSYLPNPLQRNGCSKPALGTQRTYYQNVKTGLSMLATAYVEADVYSIPPDVTRYCGKTACTIIAGPHDLTLENNLLKGDCDGAECYVQIGSLGNSRVLKMGWTDVFDPEPNPTPPATP